MATTLEAGPAFRSLFPMQLREQKIDIDSFARRHIGPNDNEIDEMLREIGFENLDLLIDAAVPKNIRLDRPLKLPEAKSEADALAELRAISKKNKVDKTFIGAG
jgi:glycine dehydrogenase